MKIYESVALGQLLERGADQVPEKTAVIDGTNRQTYSELNSMADALAVSLAEIGLKKGDRTAIYMPNSIEFMVVFYALQKLGVIVAWVNPLYRMTEAKYILNNSGARAVFISGEWDGRNFHDDLLDFRNELPALEHIFIVGEDRGQGAYSFHDLINQGKNKTPAPVEIHPQSDLAMLLYTSGTTGQPKGAMITHYAAVRAGWEYSVGVNAASDDIFIGFLPMSHSYGCGAILIQTLLLQATVALMDKFEVEKAFQIIEQHRVTVQLGAPPHYILELNHKNRSKYDLSCLRAGMIAGMIAPEGLITRVEKEMGIYLTSFWGASEVGPGLGTICPYPSPLEVREKYIGRPVADTRIRIVEPASSKEVENGEIGELTTKGWHVMRYSGFTQATITPNFCSA